MQYMLMICGVEPDGVDDDPEMEAAGERWAEEMSKRGVRLHGSRLRPTRDATTVRVRRGELLVSDGPFAETYEQMLGYDLLECANLDEAIEVAAAHPVARVGTIEVRPIWP